MIRTPHFIQITGTADLTKIGICASSGACDGGGELDPHGAQNVGNPCVDGDLPVLNPQHQRPGLQHRVRRLASPDEP